MKIKVKDIDDFTKVRQRYTSSRLAIEFQQWCLKVEIYKAIEKHRLLNVANEFKRELYRSNIFVFNSRYLWEQPWNTRWYFYVNKWAITENWSLFLRQCVGYRQSCMHQSSYNLLQASTFTIIKGTFKDAKPRNLSKNM